jgi:hypothetical protein
MVGEVLQPRLHAPVIFAGHEDEGVGRPDLFCEGLQRGRRLAAGMLLVHAVEHGEVDRPRVDELGRCTAFGKGADEPLGEANALPVGSIRAVEDQDPIGHRRNSL